MTGTEHEQTTDREGRTDEADAGPRVAALRGARVMLYRGDPGETFCLAVAEAQALVLPSAGPRLDASLFDDAGRLRLIQYTGAGWDRIASAVWQPRGWTVCNVPGVNAKDVAEYVVISAGTLLRRFKLGDRLIREGQYLAAREELAAQNVLGFSGLTIGIVGLGHIGMAAATLFRRFDTSIVYYDPVTAHKELAEAQGYQSSTLENLLELSDVVSVHVPATSDTKGLIGSEEIARMKPSAVLIQASRGGVVVQSAVLSALKGNRIAGAALDVFDEEPIPSSEPFLSDPGLRDRLILTPHIAGVTRQAAYELYRNSWNNVRNLLLLGEPPNHQVGRAG